MRRGCQERTICSFSGCRVIRGETLCFNVSGPRGTDEHGNRAAFLSHSTRSTRSTSTSTKHTRSSKGSNTRCRRRSRSRSHPPRQQHAWPDATQQWALSTPGNARDFLITVGVARAPPPRPPNFFFFFSDCPPFTLACAPNHQTVQRKRLHTLTSLCMSIT